MPRGFEIYDRIPLYRDRLTTHSVAVLAAYLASRACEANGGMFAGTAGRYTKPFIGIADGWVAPDAHEVTVEDIAEHFAEIEEHGYDGLVPFSVDEEVEAVNDLIVSLPQPAV
jgi:hypothetical protein